MSWKLSRCVSPAAAAAAGPRFGGVGKRPPRAWMAARSVERSEADEEDQSSAGTAGERTSASRGAGCLPLEWTRLDQPGDDCVTRGGALVPRLRKRGMLMQGPAQPPSGSKKATMRRYADASLLM